MGQVAGGPAVSGPEGLGLGGLGVPHDAEPVLVGAWGDYPVVPDPGPLPAYGEVICLVVRPSMPVSACTVSSHRVGRLLNVLGR